MSEKLEPPLEMAVRLESFEPGTVAFIIAADRAAVRKAVLAELRERVEQRRCALLDGNRQHSRTAGKIDVLRWVIEQIAELEAAS